MLYIRSRGLFNSFSNSFSTSLSTTTGELTELIGRVLAHFLIKSSAGGLLNHSTVPFGGSNEIQACRLSSQLEL